MAKATIDELAAAYTHQKERVYSALRKRQREHEALYEGTYKTGLDASHFNLDFKQPRGYRLVQNPVNHVAMDNIVVSRTPLLRGPKGQESEKSRQEADLVERWCQAVLDWWAEVPPYFLRELLFNLTKNGEAYSRLHIDPLAIEDPEEYKGNPFSIEVPDAMSIYASLDMDMWGSPREVWQETVVTVRQVRQMLQRWHQKGVNFAKNIDDSQFVNLVEYHSETLRAFFAISQTNSSQVWSVPLPGGAVVANPYGFVPYVRGFSGYGQWPRDGNPARVAVGMLTGYESAIVNEARIDSMMETHTAKHVAPLGVFRTAPGYKLVTNDLQLGPGHVVQLTDDTKIDFKFEPVPDMPKGILEMKQALAQMFEAFQPGVMTGIYESGGEAAISRSSRLNQAGLQWHSLYKGATAIIASSLSLVLRSLETTIEAGVELRGFRLKPDHIKGEHKVFVNLEPGNPEEKRYNWLMGKSLTGYWPQRKIVEDLYNEPDATQFQVDLLVDEILKNDPSVRRVIVEEALKLRGRRAEVQAMRGAPMNRGAPAGGAGGMSTEGVTGTTIGQVAPGVGGSPTRGVPPMPGAGQPVAGREIL